MRYLRKSEAATTKSGTARQGGSAVLLAATSIIVLGTGLVMAQISASKADTNAATASQSTATGTQQAAALAAAAGVTFVNNLSVSDLCAGSTGCSSGVYGISALSGGASGQSSSWWTSGNAHSYTYPGLNSPVLYAVEEVSCTAGLTTYKITARAVANSSSSGLQGENVAFYTKTATRTWTGSMVTLYEYSCDTHNLGYSGSQNVSFTANTNNISPYTTNSPYPAFSGGSVNITEVRVGIGTWSQYNTITFSILVNGVTKYTATTTANPQNTTGYSLCASGYNYSVLPISPTVAVNWGDTVQINFGQDCTQGYNCSVAAIHKDTTGKSPGNNNSNQVRYRVIGQMNACPA